MIRYGRGVFHPTPFEKVSSVVYFCFQAYRIELWVTTSSMIVPGKRLSLRTKRTFVQPLCPVNNPMKGANPRKLTNLDAKPTFRDSLGHKIDAPCWAEPSRHLSNASPYPRIPRRPLVMLEIDPHGSCSTYSFLTCQLWIIKTIPRIYIIATMDCQLFFSSPSSSPAFP
jgi:hypothetical protein